MRPEKQLLLDEIKEKMEKSNAMIIASYERLDPQLSWDFHEKLRENDSDFEVVKKRIFLKMAHESGFEIVLKDLPGHVGIVFAFADPYALTKTVYTFNEDNENFLKILSGRVEKKNYSAKELEVLAKLPSQNEMRAQLLGLFEAPMAQTLSVMENLVLSVVYCLENKSSSK